MQQYLQCAALFNTKKKTQTGKKEGQKAVSDKVKTYVDGVRYAERENHCRVRNAGREITKRRKTSGSSQRRQGQCQGSPRRRLYTKRPDREG